MKTLLAIAALTLTASCTGPQLGRVVSTTEVWYGYTDFANEDGLGLGGGMESSTVGVSIRPFINLEPPREVVVVKD
jgi:hypothetical protein